MSSSTPVVTYILTKEKHTLVYTVLGIIGILPLSLISITSFTRQYHIFPAGQFWKVYYLILLHHSLVCNGELLPLIFHHLQKLNFNVTCEVIGK